MSEVKDKNLYKRSIELLHELYGPTSTFREGQYEAIEATLTNKRTLVVQRTGWGKSLVYFMSTKIIRERGGGATMVISPLLSLMDNQRSAAEDMGLTCRQINYKTKEQIPMTIMSLMKGEIDLFFITPEYLSKDEFKEQLNHINIGLIVVDEAHCISTWGHDFRLEYGQINRVLQYLPKNIPILATTATANQRVKDDLAKQFGNDTFVSTGNLMRDNLSIQVMKIESRIDRYAWLLQYIPTLPGTGIIYCLTRNDCRKLAEFLKGNGIAAEPYYSRNGSDIDGEAENDRALDAFMHNEIKVIIATIKLGMGYDKKDVSFIIHFQTPENIISYYQQIGRAGRSIDRATTILMHGREDDRINEYFIETAFPTENEMVSLRQFITEHPNCKLSEIQAALNIPKGRIEKALYFLTNGGYISIEYLGSKTYVATPKVYNYDRERYETEKSIRRKELDNIHELIDTDECYNRFIVNCLDDSTDERCGICANCCNESLPTETDDICREKAQQYLENAYKKIDPKKRWPTNTKVAHPHLEGLCLSKYGERPFGDLVQIDKYKNKHFCDTLVEKSSKILSRPIREHGITQITFVPSLRSDIVRDFTMRLAKKCNLQFVELLGKREARPQKEMNNTIHQYRNAEESFFPLVQSNNSNIIVVDDVIDSGFTLAVCSDILGRIGCVKVFPFALADSSNN